MLDWLAKLLDTQVWIGTFDLESPGVIAVAVYMAMEHVGIFQEMAQ